MKIAYVRSTLQLIFDWSEVWVLLIPLFVLFIVRKDQPPFLKPVILYLWIALVINLTADVIADFKASLPVWAQSNNPLYNVHSLARFACFSYFFFTISRKQAGLVKKLLPVALVSFVILNFSSFESFINPTRLSGNLLAVEAYLLLIYCMQYYLSRLQEEVWKMADEKSFWIVTGLSIYVVINFFLFLFYNPMIDENLALARQMWNVHNIAYIIFCILIAKAFYVPSNN